MAASAHACGSFWSYPTAVQIKFHTILNFLMQISTRNWSANMYRNNIPDNSHKNPKEHFFSGSFMGKVFFEIGNLTICVWFLGSHKLLILWNKIFFRESMTYITKDHRRYKRKRTFFVYVFISFAATLIKFSWELCWNYVNVGVATGSKEQTGAKETWDGFAG